MSCRNTNETEGDKYRKIVAENKFHLLIFTFRIGARILACATLRY